MTTTPTATSAGVEAGSSGPSGRQLPEQQPGQRGEGQPPRVVSADIRTVLRRARMWIVFVLIAAVIAVITLLSAGTNGNRTDRGPANPAPEGTLGLVSVLRQQGVRVTVVDSRAAAARAASANSTLLVDDANRVLTTSTQWRSVAGITAGTTVLVTPSATALAALAPDVRGTGSAKAATLQPGCVLQPPARAGAITITADDRTYRATGSGSGCYTSGRGFALVRSAERGSSVWVLGDASLLTNGRIDQRGNAAVALGLTGGHRSLVWYVPGIADAQAGRPPSLADLTPGWVTPLMGLLAAVVIAAAFWRGRRFGPLVVENLPVVVRSGETVEGRARLYQRSNTRLHALDALRIGTAGRIALALNLSTAAPIREVSDAAAAAVNADPRLVFDLLVGAEPATDADLVRLSDDLTHLERAVRENSQTGRMNR